MKFEFNPMFPEATREQKWSQFKLYRMAQMQMSDWTQSTDCTLSETQIAAFQDYRTLLKNAPNLYQNVEDIELPGYVAVVDYNIVYVAAPYKVQPILKGR